MGRVRILLDSNAYFRLARSIRPLLDKEFGDEARFCLYVISDLEKEFRRSRRLQSKFSWVDQDEYRLNRERPLTMSRSDRSKIKEAYDYIQNHARQDGLATSTVDMMALATAYVLGIQVVTDDQEMRELAESFGISATTSLELMRLMVDAGRINIEDVRTICRYWEFERDLPANFRNEYQRIFGESPPPPV